MKNTRVGSSPTMREPGHTQQRMTSWKKPNVEILLFIRSRASHRRLRSTLTAQSQGISLNEVHHKAVRRVCLLVACLTSQQHASVSQGRICSDNFTCCHTEIEVAGPTFYLTQSQYTDTGPTSASADPITPGAWQGSHWSANF